jgi:hypothetical protein
MWIWQHVGYEHAPGRCPADSPAASLHAVCQIAMIAHDHKKADLTELGVARPGPRKRHRFGPPRSAGRAEDTQFQH